MAVCLKHRTGCCDPCRPKNPRVTIPSGSSSTSPKSGKAVIPPGDSVEIHTDLENFVLQTGFDKDDSGDDIEATFRLSTYTSTLGTEGDDSGVRTTENGFSGWSDAFDVVDITHLGKHKGDHTAKYTVCHTVRELDGDDVAFYRPTSSNEVVEGVTGSKIFTITNTMANDDLTVTFILYDYTDPSCGTCYDPCRFTHSVLELLEPGESITMEMPFDKDEPMDISAFFQRTTDVVSTPDTCEEEGKYEVTVQYGVDSVNFKHHCDCSGWFARVVTSPFRFDCDDYYYGSSSGGGGDMNPDDYYDFMTTEFSFVSTKGSYIFPSGGGQYGRNTWETSKRGASVFITNAGQDVRYEVASNILSTSGGLTPVSQGGGSNEVTITNTGTTDIEASLSWDNCGVGDIDCEGTYQTFTKIPWWNKARTGILRLTVEGVPMTISAPSGIGNNPPTTIVFATDPNMVIDVPTSVNFGPWCWPMMDTEDAVTVNTQYTRTAYSIGGTPIITTAQSPTVCGPTGTIRWMTPFSALSFFTASSGPWNQVTLALDPDDRGVEETKFYVDGVQEDSEVYKIRKKYENHPATMTLEYILD